MKIFLMIMICGCLMSTVLNAQQKHPTTNSNASNLNKTTKENINHKRDTTLKYNNSSVGYKRDSSDVNQSRTAGGNSGMSQLSGTPGPATTTGEGGLGTNDKPGYNTSSDIYNIEHRDSVKRARDKRAK